MSRLDANDFTAPKRAARFFRFSIRERPGRVVLPGVARDWKEINSTLAECVGEMLSGRRIWPLYLYGPTGRGKTSAALCMLDLVGGCFTTAERWASVVYQREHALWTYTAETPLLIVDEIGKSGDEFQRERLALDELADIRNYRPTVWISNHDPKALENLFDERFASRLTCGTCVRVGGRDRRKKEG